MSATKANAPSASRLRSPRVHPGIEVARSFVECSPDLGFETNAGTVDVVVITVDVIEAAERLSAVSYTPDERA